ncbi:MAG: histidine phosphatase family protein [Burkholderiales bacterium]
MKATRIIAVRHGETAWNVGNRVQGHLDIPLNSIGREQVTRLGQALASEAVEAIYASDLWRAWDTAHAIASAAGSTSAKRVKIEEGLRERRLGAFEGKTFTEIEALWPDASRRWRQREPDFAPNEGGESLLAFRERVLEALNRLAAEHVGSQIILVAHGGVMDVLYRHATGQDLQAKRTWALGNAAINRLLWSEQSLALVGWADTQHLDNMAEAALAADDASVDAVLSSTMPPATSAA